MQRAAYVKTGCMALFSLVLVVSILSFPQQSFDASLRGLTIWWEVVFPALLPFFITSELLMGFGVVHFLGVLLEPCMRPLFRVPGVGGFVMSMGIASGYPMGAKLTVRLREEELITRAEGERLVSITSTSGPLFMIGAVAVGFFHDVRLGVIIALSHYLSAICVGLIMRFHHYHESKPPKKRRSFFPQNNHNILYRALQAMHRARVKDGRTIGQLMGDAVLSSIQTLLLIGGFIIMFSVIINILHIIGLNKVMAFFLTLLLFPVGVDPALIHALLAGLFEITLGTQMASEAGDGIPLAHKVAIASAIIAWSGLSVHAQVASMLARTDIRYSPYLLARLIHAALACAWTYVLWKPLLPLLAHLSLPAITQSVPQNVSVWSHSHLFVFSTLLTTALVLVIASLIFFAFLQVKKRQF
ncbi:sporulation integral membrane protein YlbJ [Caldalkalibacillus uzonensis]|uniref:Sporulation integral membrane protein YlbJ n=1 Tax=Caldalkalibacillus uzonensis TaxID=353224 RepID=A0ABU0CTG6_9BACI|nr:sporulation integral membrane protein YlbJ [Caldalkalibacillus uzonensis]MDQ0339196.1 sporulation integral membrane protein YlbJ [Caldalkalibacillus uzonensis]